MDNTNSSHPQPIASTPSQTPTFPNMNGASVSSTSDRNRSNDNQSSSTNQQEGVEADTNNDFIISSENVQVSMGAYDVAQDVGHHYTETSLIGRSSRVRKKVHKLTASKL